MEPYKEGTRVQGVAAPEEGHMPGLGSPRPQQNYVIKDSTHTNMAKLIQVFFSPITEVIEALAHLSTSQRDDGTEHACAQPWVTQSSMEQHQAT